MSGRPPLRPLFNNFVRARHTGLTPYKEAPRFKLKSKRRSRGKINFEDQNDELDRPQTSPASLQLDQLHSDGRTTHHEDQSDVQGASSLSRSQSTSHRAIDLCSPGFQNELGNQDVESIAKPEAPLELSFEDEPEIQSETNYPNEEQEDEQINRPESPLACSIEDELQSEIIYEPNQSEQQEAEHIDRPESPLALSIESLQQPEVQEAQPVDRAESPLVTPIEDQLQSCSFGFNQQSEDKQPEVTTPGESQSTVVPPTQEDQQLSERSSGAKAQRDKVDFETSRLLNLAEQWNQIQLETVSLPEWVVDEIDSVVGQTRLLTTSKFRQFRSLITEYEGGDPKVKLEDLDGFWEMMYIQVEGLDTKYKKLEDLKESQWERKVEVQKRKPKKKGKKKAPVVHSRIKDLIKERRKSIIESPVKDIRRDSSIFVPFQEITLSTGFDNLEVTGRRSSFYYRID